MSDKPSKGRERPPTHAGGVVYRLRNGAPEFLLVTARRNPREWVLPKGHIEDDETPGDAAAREVEEEAGVLAVPERPLGQMIVRVRGQEQRIDYFLMQRIREGRGEEFRDVCWLPLEDAVKRLTFDDTRDLVRRAALLI
jgi:8-oxo-dGTP pyrophosphatase MutT (NUDIX family)